MTYKTFLRSVELTALVSTVSKMQVVRTNGKWQITGPGSDRARIVYARLENDRVVYDLQ